MAALSNHSPVDGLSRQRWTAAAAVVGGTIWAILPLVFTYDTVIYSVEVLDPYDPSLLPTLAIPLLIVGVWGFYERLGDGYSSRGRRGLWTIGIGLLGLWPFGSLEFLRLYFGLSVGFAVGFGVLFLAIFGAIVIEVGAIELGIDSWQTDTPSKWLGVWFPMALPVSVLVNYGAAGLFDLLWMGNHYYAGLSGLAWIGLGYYLLQSRDGGQDW